MTKLTGSLYPRGFHHISIPGQPLQLDPGHRGVDHVMDLLFTGRVNTQGFSYYREVFPIAMEFFTDFNRFLQLQKNNPFLYGYNYEFLLDTLKFIATGCRKVSIHNWKPLLAEWAEPHSDHRLRASSGLPVEFKPFVGKPGAEVVAQWCSHPNGLEDMVMTLGLMFGSSFERETTESTSDRLQKLIQLFT